MKTDDLRVVYTPNIDDEYPWPWTARLQERDGGEWAGAFGPDGRPAFADGETPRAAFEALCIVAPIALVLPVKVPKDRRKARPVGGSEA